MDKRFAPLRGGSTLMVEANIPYRQKTNIILRLWSGEVALWKTYWLFGSLGSIILTSLVTWLTYQVNYHAADFSQFDRYAFSYSLLTFIYLYTLVILVGIWRSAKKYRIKYPDRRGNATLAQTAVVFGALVSVGSFAQGFFNSTSNSIDAIRKSGTPEEKLQLEATIAGLNKDLPKMINSITRLDSIDANDHEIIYLETITQKLDRKADTAALLQTKVKPKRLIPLSQVALDVVCGLC